MTEENITGEIGMRSGLVLSILAAASFLTACNENENGHELGAEAASTLTTSKNAVLPDTAQTPLELELEPKGLRYGLAKDEAIEAENDAAAAMQRSDEATLRATSHQAISNEDIALEATPGSSAAIVSDLTAFVTPENGKLDCESPARDVVLQRYTNALRSAVPTHWEMGERYTQEVDSIMSAPGAYALLSRANKAPQAVLMECAQAVEPRNVVNIAMLMADAACTATSRSERIKDTQIQGLGDTLGGLRAGTLQQSVASACADLKSLRPSHPLLKEAEAVKKLYQTVWSSTLVAHAKGRKEMNAQLAAAAVTARGEADAAKKHLEALREEIAQLEEPNRLYQAEVKARMQREALAARMQAEIRAEEFRRQAVAAAKAREHRERAWRAAGNSGLSPEGSRECRRDHGMTLYSLVNASTAIAMQQGKAGAAEWVIDEARQRGISDECIQLLARG